MAFAASSTLIFQSPDMQLVLRAARGAISAPGAVLICGEVGTGRETLARAIHQAATGLRRIPLEQLLQDRSSALGSLAPFVVVDCAAASDVESLLFGPVAIADHDGLESISTQALGLRARGGTLFLRSIQEMPRRVQSRLARVLRDGEVWLEHEDQSRVVALQSRVIASMDSTVPFDSEPLLPELQKRLAFHRIQLPPLRQRREDLPALVQQLLAQICASRGLPAKSASRQAILLLSALPWRGNLNELRGLLQTLIARVPGRRIRLADVLANVQLDGRNVTFSTSETLREARERFEREYVAAVLEQHEGRMTDAAKALGVQRANLYRKVRQLAMRRKAWAPAATAPAETGPTRAHTRAHTSGYGPRKGEDDSMEIL